MLIVAVLVSSCTTPYEPSPLPKSPVVVAATQPAPSPIPVQALNVSISVGRGSPEVGQAISFVVSSGAPITRAAWSFGNGATSITNDGATAYAYPATGTFTASVTVTASDGRTGSDQQSVTVRRRQTTPTPTPTPPQPPSAPALSLGLTCTAKPALTATPCNVTASYGGAVLPSSQTTSVVWDFGDGPPPVTTPGPVVSHPYPQAGSYTVFAAATVSTVDGAKTATTSRAVTIP